ncbi:MAG: hypothetical protein AB8G99_24470 [Planctomycetaceae bacterium]
MHKQNMVNFVICMKPSEIDILPVFDTELLPLRTNRWRRWILLMTKLVTNWYGKLLKPGDSAMKKMPREPQTTAFQKQRSDESNSR